MATASASARSVVTQKASKAPRGNSLRGRSVPICSLGTPRRERADRCNSFTAFTELGALSVFQPLHKMLHGRETDWTHRSMTTGSEGVSLRLPHDFFSQQRLKKETERERFGLITERGRKHCDSGRVLHCPPSARPLISLAHHLRIAGRRRRRVIIRPCLSYSGLVGLELRLHDH